MSERDPAARLDVEAFRRLGHRAVDIASDYLAGIAKEPVFRPLLPAERQALLDQPLPPDGIPADALLDQFCARILTHPMGNGHPRFFGWVNSPPDPVGIVADLLAATMDPSVAGGDHAAVYLERAVVRWLMELVGFPVAGSMGLLVSGGSMASLTGLAAARHWAASQYGWDVRAQGLQTRGTPLVLYLSAEGHTCLRKAAEILGVGSENMRSIPVDDCFRLDVAALKNVVAQDRARGLRPFCVAASAGTVNTGAIDPLDQLADFCAEQNLWLHVDGAYGAFGILAPEKTARYKGLERVHSLGVDPHKWLSVPVECGCAFVRDGKLLRDTFSLVAPYLRTEEGKGFGGLPWYSEYGFQQTRGFRALKTWMVLAHAGRNGLAALVNRHVDLARRLAELVDAAPDLERMAPVELSVVCFRYVPPGKNLKNDELDALNKALMEQVQAGGEVFLSSTILNGRFALRACVLHHSTAEADLAALVEVVRRVGRALR